MSTQDEISVSYDIGTGFYESWLDRNMSYSCALWDGANSLDEAQDQKLAWHHAAARVEPHKYVLDVGCGWGANLEYLVRRGVRRACGITLSRAQYAAVKAKQLPGVEIECVSFRDFCPQERFDAVISIGMLEHVATPEEQRSGEHITRYREYFDLIWQWTQPGSCFGLQLVQTLRLPRRGADLKELAWTTRAIFPGAIAPRIEDVVTAAHPRWEVVAVATRRIDYARTTAEWLRRLKEREPTIRRQWPQHYEEYERYLAACVQSFDKGYLSLGQYALKRLD